MSATHCFQLGGNYPYISILICLSLLLWVISINNPILWLFTLKEVSVWRRWWVLCPSSWNGHPPAREGQLRTERRGWKGHPTKTIYLYVHTPHGTSANAVLILPMPSQQLQHTIHSIFPGGWACWAHCTGWCGKDWWEFGTDQGDG